MYLKEITNTSFNAVTVGMTGYSQKWQNITMALGLYEQPKNGM